MLSKTPRRAAIVQACINQPDKQASPLPHEVWIWLGDKLAEDLSAKFLHLARTPESSAGIYSARMRSVLYEWMFYAMWATRRSEDHLPDLLPDVKYKAMALRRHLEDVRRLHLEAAVLDPRASWYDNGVLEHLPLSVVDSALEALATLIGALNRVTSGRRGRSRGTKVYPGLDNLVKQLERHARWLNGKFTLDKRHGKGTLIEALDWLRAQFLREPEWKWLAQYLPAPGRHPLAVYESAMREGRTIGELLASSNGPD